MNDKGYPDKWEIVDDSGSSCKIVNQASGDVAYITGRYASASAEKICRDYNSSQDIAKIIRANVESEVSPESNAVEICSEIGAMLAVSYPGTAGAVMSPVIQNAVSQIIRRHINVMLKYVDVSILMRDWPESLGYTMKILMDGRVCVQVTLASHEIGPHPLTITAYGSTVTDALKNALDIWSRHGRQSAH